MSPSVVLEKATKFQIKSKSLLDNLLEKYNLKSEYNVIDETGHGKAWGEVYLEVNILSQPSIKVWLYGDEIEWFPDSFGNNCNYERIDGETDETILGSFLEHLEQQINTK